MQVARCNKLIISRNGEPSQGNRQARQEKDIFQRRQSKSLSSKEYAATTKAKRKGTAAGKQFVRQPKKIAKKTRKFRTA